MLPSSSHQHNGVGCCGGGGRGGGREGRQRGNKGD